MDFAEAQGASLILRGLRAVADFEYEYQMAGMNQQLNDRIETVFLMADVSLQPIASRLVKEIARYGGAIDKFVTACGRDGRRREAANSTGAGDVRWDSRGGIDGVGELNMIKSLVALPFLALALIAAKPAAAARRSRPCRSWSRRPKLPPIRPTAGRSNCPTAARSSSSFARTSRRSMSTGSSS